MKRDFEIFGWAPRGWSLKRDLERLRTELRKQWGLAHGVEEFSEALAGREMVFRAPPLDPHLIDAIRRVSPQHHLRPGDESRRVWELNQNGSCWGEFEALEPLLRSLGDPGRVLDLGAGLGRSTVFFKQQLGWQDVPFDLYDADGPKQKYPLLAARTRNSFCGDLAALRQVLEFNGVRGWEIHDAAALCHGLRDLPGPYGLVYSFYGIGFHWSLEEFWLEILDLLAEDGVGIFTVHRRFEEFAALRAIAHGYITFRRVLARDRPLDLLVVSRRPERIAPFVGERR